MSCILWESIIKDNEGSSTISAYQDSHIATRKRRNERLLPIVWPISHLIVCSVVQDLALYIGFSINTKTFLT